MEPTDAPQDPNDDGPSKFLTLNEASGDVIAERIQEDLSYLRSNKTWERLKVPPALVERLLQLGFKAPSKIQASVIPLARRSSVFAQSQNGSGKTLAFLIPAILQVDLSKPRTLKGKAAPQVIILADTRPLIGQIKAIVERLVEGFKDELVVDGLFSGTEPTKEGAHIMVTTIGFLKGLVTKKKLVELGNVALLVVDEADKVMKSDMSTTFLPQLVIRGAPEDMRLILTTATSTFISKNFVEKIQEKKRIVSLEIQKEKLTLKNVQQLCIECDTNQRLPLLHTVLSSVTNVQNILIFTNSKRVLRELNASLLAANHKVAMVCSNVSKDIVKEAEEINQKIKDFLAGKYRILITTDLLSRGIDTRKVTLVVNLELPRYYKDQYSALQGQADDEADVETYLHRVGRTGRYGDHGIALNFVTSEQQRKIHNEIVAHYKIEMTTITENDLEELDQKLAKVNATNTIKREEFGENI